MKKPEKTQAQLLAEARARAIAAWADHEKNMQGNTAFDRAYQEAVRQQDLRHPKKH